MYVQHLLWRKISITLSLLILRLVEEIQPWRRVWYETFLDAFFAVSTCLAIGFVASSCCLLLSISKHCHLMMIPWNVVNMLIILFITFLLLAEMYFKPNQQNLSKYFFIALSFSIYCTFNLIWGVIIYIQIKKKNNEKSMECCERFEYMELETFHNPNDNLSWYWVQRKEIYNVNKISTFN